MKPVYWWDYIKPGVPLTTFYPAILKHLRSIQETNIMNYSNPLWPVGKGIFPTRTFIHIIKRHFNSVFSEILTVREDQNDYIAVIFQRHRTTPSLWITDYVCYNGSEVMRCIKRRVCVYTSTALYTFHCNILDECAGNAIICYVFAIQRLTET